MVFSKESGGDEWIRSLGKWRDGENVVLSWDLWLVDSIEINPDGNSYALEVL